jgi:hypothetical protein
LFQGALAGRAPERLKQNAPRTALTVVSGEEGHVANEWSGLIFLVPVAVILGVFTIIGLGIVRSTKVREIRMRERIAMIERGLTPPPEVDPEAFDRATAASLTRARRRFVGAGIIVVGLGLAVGLIIGLAAEQMRVAMGVGGAVVVIGLALIANGALNTGE